MDAPRATAHTCAVSHPQILLLENIHPSARHAYEDAGWPVEAIGRGLGEGELIDALGALEPSLPLVLGIRSKSRVTARVLEAVPQLAVIGAYCIGTDQIDLPAARRQGVAVFNAPFSSTRSVAELVVGEVIMLSRQIFARSQAAHAGRWAKSAEGSHEVRGKTLGLVGYGHIGSQVSVLAEALGMRVQYFDVVSKLPLGNATACASLDELLETSDFVSLHVPDTSGTRQMIGETEIARMKPGAHLLNLSRGQVVDLEALRGAVTDGKLAGAAIDVYPREPAKAGDAFDTPLRGLPSVILTPHIGGSTLEAQANIGREVSSAVTAFLAGGRSTGCVNLPQLDAPPLKQGSRIINIHRNVPGVLSEINRVVAQAAVNIDRQHLATLDEVGMLILDVSVDRDAPAAQDLATAIAGLETSIRTRIQTAESTDARVPQTTVGRVG
ncbi:MAG: phosphoglycerate dehydrogenase [Myxococcales bacterium FL481]|nr:MAG: phosphoglycerate dehydrogenase [Myxococcales bacterium FL481]